MGFWIFLSVLINYIHADFFKINFFILPYFTSFSCIYYLLFNHYDNYNSTLLNYLFGRLGDDTWHETPILRQVDYEADAYEDQETNQALHFIFFFNFLSSTLRPGNYFPRWTFNRFDKAIVMEETSISDLQHIWNDVSV